MSTANDELMRILKFTEDELAVNRVGDVTEGQLARFKQKIAEKNNQFSLLLFILLPVCLMYFAAQFIVEKPAIHPVVGLSLFVGMLMLTLWGDRYERDKIKKAFESQVVMKIDAPMLFREHRHYLVLRGLLFQVDKSVYEQLRALRSREGKDVVYRWYFLKDIALILSSEQLETVSPPKTDEKASDDHSK